MCVAIHGNWIPVQICLEQICIYPKVIMPDSLMWIPAGMTGFEILVNNDKHYLLGNESSETKQHSKNLKINIKKIKV